MKIIGTTSENFLVEATADELAKLCGYHSDWRRRNDIKRGFSIGDEIHVAAMYDHLYKLGIEHRNIRDTASKLRTAANLLDVLPDPITEAEAKPDSEEVAP